jgi:hypothetical protein
MWVTSQTPESHEDKKAHAGSPWESLLALSRLVWWQRGS